ncbi:MAG: aminotransferase class I/II-fold pyridoxal phosphate-dependent enzyme [Bacillota bacterium]|nr:aminotransferase class I/II-fold pyridoxal phosphate-dependent enzyme [Bacillota bacterium]
MIPLSIPEICGNEMKYLKECLDSGWVSSAGPFVTEFESKFKEYLGAKYSIATVNGTSALHLALRCLDIGEGDEVIVPSMTFAATVNAIIYVGAKPVFADICEDTYVLDADKLEALITGRTKAILPVHLYGQPVDMDRIMEISRKYGLYVVEDAAESLGSIYKGKFTGAIGHIGCFSFNGNKLITAGNGGMLVTDDLKLAEYALHLATQAKDNVEEGGFYHSDIGYNYRMSNINAALALAQLETIDNRVGIKRKNAKLYDDLLNDVKGLTLPQKKNRDETVLWLYPILIHKNFKENRKELMTRLKYKGIETRPFFVPIHSMKPYANFNRGDMRNTDFISNIGLNLPSSVGLTTDDIKEVCRCILE